MKKILLTLMVLLSIFLVSCGSGTGVQLITPEEAKAMRDEDNSVIFVDVREQSEYDEEHIQAAILLPLGTIESNAVNVIPDKSVVYIIYCRTGNRSATASQLLVDLGYENIYDMGFEDLCEVGVMATILRIVPLEQGGAQVVLNMEKLINIRG